MSLPAAWVESLFARLTVRYGAAFMRQYADLDAASVKADWGDVLGGFAGKPEAIRYALDHLPSDRPLNAMQFRAICNAAPIDAPLAITNEVRADPQKVADLVSAIKTPQPRDLRQWARDLKAAEESGVKLSMAQRDAWRRALQTEESWTN